MYEYIRGSITAEGGDYIIIENNGIGYRVYTSINTLAKVHPGDKEAILYTHLHVREDAMQLYGFSDTEELSLFSMLISISGIGPKGALAILSAFTPREVALAIAGDKPQVLSKAKGVGKKTAQRIILELKDKFRALEKEAAVDETIEPADGTIADEARTALMVLGYTAREARKVVENSIEDSMTLEELIRACLKELNG